MQRFPPIFAVTVFAAGTLSISARDPKEPPGPSPADRPGPGLVVVSSRPDGAVNVRLAPDLIARLPKPADAPEGGRPASFLLHRIRPSLVGPPEMSEIGAGDAVELSETPSDLELFAGDKGFAPGLYRIGLHAVIEGTPAKTETAGTRFWRGPMDQWAAEIEREHAGLLALLDEWKGKGEPEEGRRLRAAGEYRHFDNIVSFLRRLSRKEEEEALKSRIQADAAKGGTEKGKPPEWLTAEVVAKLEREAGGGKDAGAAPPPGGGGGPGPGGAPSPATRPSAPPVTREAARELLARQALAHLFLAAEFTASAALALHRAEGSAAGASAADWTRLADLHGRLAAADPVVKRRSDDLKTDDLWRTIPSRLPEPVGAEAWRSARDRAETLRAGLRRAP